MGDIEFECGENEYVSGLFSSYTADKDRNWRIECCSTPGEGGAPWWVRSSPHRQKMGFSHCKIYDSCEITQFYSRP